MPPCCGPSKEMSTGTTVVADPGARLSCPVESAAGSARILMTGTSAVSIVLIERIQARPSNAPASWYKSLADSLCPEGSERGGVVELVIALVVEETAGPNRGEEAGEERAGERDPVAVLAVVLLLLVSLSWLWLWLSVSSSSSPATDDAALDCPVVQPVLLLVVVPLEKVTSTRRVGASWRDACPWTKAGVAVRAAKEGTVGSLRWKQDEEEGRGGTAAFSCPAACTGAICLVPLTPGPGPGNGAAAQVCGGSRACSSANGCGGCGGCRCNCCRCCCRFSKKASASLLRPRAIKVSIGVVIRFRTWMSSTL